VAAAVAATCLLVASPGVARADEVRDSQWYLDTLKVAEAQRISKGDGVVVAVLDTGVRADHPDLEGAVLDGVNVVRAGDKGNRDTEGHGTGMAAVIAGRGRSGDRGVLGIAPAATILPIRPSGQGDFVADGVRYAAENGAKVLNMSFGVTDGERLSAAIKEAVEADIVLVAAAGNSGDEGNQVEFPAGYPEVIAVGATDEDGKVGAYSQHGPQVDLVAPGTDVLMAGLGDDYRRAQGTSTAAAIVSGAAALIRAKYPDLTAKQVGEMLTSTAVDKGDPGRDDYYGAGALDLVAALNATPAASAPPATGGATQPPAVPAAEAESDEGGLSPLVIVGIGVVVLIVAGVGVLVAVRRAQRG
jgi:type VII secretion-associated serine protease mycosin